MKKCKHDVYYYCDKAEKGGLKVDFNFQGHPIIRSPKDDESIMLPSNLQSSHTEGLIRKWLIRFGVILLIIGLLYFL